MDIRIASMGFNNRDRKPDQTFGNWLRCLSTDHFHTPDRLTYPVAHSLFELAIRKILNLRDSHPSFRHRLANLVRISVWLAIDSLAADF
jgi:hypothetical protein